MTIGRPAHDAALYAAVSNRICEQMQARDISPRALAEKLGIAESTLSRYRNGRRMPNGIHLVKIAQALETTAEYLALGIPTET